MVIVGRTTFTVPIESAYLSALSDVGGLSRAELRAEKLIEYCIYQYFGYQTPAPIEQLLGYSSKLTDVIGYLTDEEFHAYNNDLTYILQCIERLNALLMPALKTLQSIAGEIVNVVVRGRVVDITFNV